MEPGATSTGGAHHPAAPVRAEPVLTWPLCGQLAVLLLLTAGVFFVLGRMSSGFAPTPLEKVELQRPRLDINRATHGELRTIPGIGDSLAQAVIDYRQQHGPFRDLNELRQVHGVGVKTLDRIRAYVCIESEESFVTLDEAMPESQGTPARTAPPNTKAARLTGPINVNTADLLELQKLPGIGPKLSQRIIDERTKSRFQSVEDLRRVPGIGPKTLEKLRPHVETESRPSAFSKVIH